MRCALYQLLPQHHRRAWHNMSSGTFQRQNSLTSVALEQHERTFLDKNGYLIIKDVLCKHELISIQERIHEIFVHEGQSAGAVTQSPAMKYLAAETSLFASFMRPMYSLAFSCVRLCSRIFFRISPGLKSYYAGLATTAALSFSHHKWWQRELSEMIATEAQQERRGILRLCDLVNKGTVFDQLYTHPRILSAVRHIIGEKFKLSSLNYRAPKPKNGLQRLHVDWDWTVCGGQYYACNVLWLLEDMTAENGATRIVPASHRSCRSPADDMPMTCPIHYHLTPMKQC